VRIARFPGGIQAPKKKTMLRIGRRGDTGREAGADAG